MQVAQTHRPAKLQVGLVLLQLGGPATQADIPAFLTELFADVLPLPAILARPLAGLIARRRMPEVGPLYAEIGGGSPLLPNTVAQQSALVTALAKRGIEAHAHIAMRYAPPRAKHALAALRALGGGVPWLALPLYPHYSYATTRSSLDELYAQMTDEEADRLQVVQAYPAQAGFVAAVAEGLLSALHKLPDASQREAHIVFSAHGLPLTLVRQGDPYPEQIKLSVAAVMAAISAQLGRTPTHTLSFQSRVGPIKWLTPSTEQSLKDLGKAGKAVIIVVPIAFVSEHIETLHELDIQLQETAQEAGVSTYRRVPTVSVQPSFIEGLCDLVESTLRIGPQPLGAKMLRIARRRGARVATPD